MVGLEKAMLKRRGKELLEIIRVGESPGPDFMPLSKPGKPDPGLRALGNAMWKRLGELCEREGIPTSAVAPRDEIRALAAGERDLRILSGWRRAFVGESLLALASPADTSSP